MADQPFVQPSSICSSVLGQSVSMEKSKPQDLLQISGSTAVATVIFLSALIKLRRPAEAVSSLENLGITGTWVGLVFAMLVVGEVILAIFLISTPESPLVRLAVTILMCGFTIFILWLIASDSHLDCGCGITMKLFKSARYNHFLNIAKNVLLIVCLNAGWVAALAGRTCGTWRNRPAGIGV